MWNLQERLEDSFSWSEELDKDVQREASCLRWQSTLSFDGFSIRSFQGTLLAWVFSSRYKVRMLTTSLWLPRPFGLDDRTGTPNPLC